jgi:DNA-binding NarL/FixJ family response regulator
LITVLVVDDQPLMRSALIMSLSGEPDIEVVGEAADGLQAVEMAGSLRPDVAIMDIRMPRLDGIDATRQLTTLDQGPVRVLVMTTFDLDEYVVEALHAGASGFVVKDITAADLIRAVRVVAGGDALLAPTVTRRLLDRYLRHLPRAEAEVEPGWVHGLTHRERDVLLLVARGLSNAAIGRELHMAESSVKTHVSHLLTKLDKQDRVHLVIHAYESGLVPTTPEPLPPV